MKPEEVLCRLATAKRMLHEATSHSASPNLRAALTSMDGALADVVTVLKEASQPKDDLSEDKKDPIPPEDAERALDNLRIFVETWKEKGADQDLLDKFCKVIKQTGLGAGHAKQRLTYDVAEETIVRNISQIQSVMEEHDSESPEYYAVQLILHQMRRRTKELTLALLAQENGE